MSTSETSESFGFVGPILSTGSPLTKSVVQAILETNRGVRTEDRGSYIRIKAPGQCRLATADVERISGVAFHLPGDLEMIMSSFAGKISFFENEVVWIAQDRPK